MSDRLTKYSTKYLMLFFWVVCFLPNIAEATTGNHLPKRQAVFQHPANKGKNRQALQKITQRLTNIRSLDASFVQRKKLKALRFPLISFGHFHFSQTKGIKWLLKKPFPALFLISDKGITQKVANKTTYIDSKKKPIIYGFTQMFLSIFSGKQKKFEQFFHIYFAQKKQSWMIGLIPKDKMLHRIFKSIILSGKQSIEHVSMYETSGDSTFIQFKKIQIKLSFQPKQTKSH